MFTLEEQIVIDAYTKLGGVRNLLRCLANIYRQDGFVFPNYDERARQLDAIADDISKNSEEWERVNL
jgi:hypothetical protein